MSTFAQLPEFEKELKKLSKKYPSLSSDIEDIKPILLATKTGIGKNFTILMREGDVTVVKVRVFCTALRARTIRLIYLYDGKKITFLFIELYFKGDKKNEDMGRIRDYLKELRETS